MKPWDMVGHLPFPPPPNSKLALPLIFGCYDVQVFPRFARRENETFLDLISFLAHACPRASPNSQARDSASLFGVSSMMSEERLELWSHWHWNYGVGMDAKT